MKRIAGFLLALLLLCLFGCAAPEQPVEDPTAIVAPATRDVKLTLPLGKRTDTSTALQTYAAGFTDPKGMAMTYRCESADPNVAICALSDDGTLFVSAAGIGETNLTVEAIAADGRAASVTVNVKVTDARRTVALIVLGVLVVALLILFGKPVKKEPEPAQAETEPEPTKTPEPEPAEAPEPEVLIVPEPEEPETQPERSLQ